ncbi:MAG: HlyD family efflux transporter periplasmic adaptor subunit [Planctomycetota bacterium]
MKHKRHNLAVMLLFTLVGCGPATRSYPEKSPLPVSVITLSETTPAVTRVYSGSVRSWKIEDIGFEVGGRIRWVVEPGTEITGRTFAADGSVATTGTQIAQLDTQRFENALQAAKAKLEIERIRRKGLQIQVDDAIPAELAAAQSALDLAKNELRRNENLQSKGAASVQILDQARAAVDQARATTQALESKLQVAKAEVESSLAAIKQAEQAVKDALRDLDDTRLYSAFAGQVAETQVVPGSLIGPGDAVATVQMMNPIKVEVEVSAARSRQLRQGDELQISTALPDGRRKQLEASIYTIASSADNATRTYTVTLLVVNQEDADQEDINQKGSDEDRGIQDNDIPITKALWRLGLGILPDLPDGQYYMPETAIHSVPETSPQGDESGTFVWRIPANNQDEPTSAVMPVEKLFVEAEPERVPFLGKAQFRKIKIKPGQNIDVRNDRFATELWIDGKKIDDFNGNQIRLQRGRRWLLRPGDLIEVDLAGANTAPGIYVPVEAIEERAGQNFLFAVDRGIAKRIEVTTEPLSGGSLRRVTPVQDDMQLVGTTVIVEGVHYVSDGQPVRILNSSDVASVAVAPEDLQ